MLEEAEEEEEEDAADGTALRVDTRASGCSATGAAAEARGATAGPPTAEAALWAAADLVDRLAAAAAAAAALGSSSA